MHKNPFYTPTHLLWRDVAAHHEGTQMGLSDSYDGNLRRERGTGREERTVFWTSATLWYCPLDVLRRNLNVTEFTVYAVLDDNG